MVGLLSVTEDPSAAAYVAERVNADEVHEVQREAARRLPKLLSKETAPETAALGAKALCDGLRDREDVVRLQCVQSLEKITQAEIPLLAVVLQTLAQYKVADPSERVRQAAAQALDSVNRPKVTT
jgi:HEAT repeat protein